MRQRRPAVRVFFLDEAGQNKTVVVPGANGQVTCSDVDCLYRNHPRRKILGAQLEVPLETVDQPSALRPRWRADVLDPPRRAAPIDETLYPYILHHQAERVRGLVADRSSP